MGIRSKGIQVKTPYRQAKYLNRPTSMYQCIVPALD